MMKMFDVCVFEQMKKSTSPLSHPHVTTQRLTWDDHPRQSCSLVPYNSYGHTPSCNGHTLIAPNNLTWCTWARKHQNQFCLFVCLFVIICLCMCMFVCLSASVCVFVYVCLFVCLFVCCLVLFGFVCFILPRFPLLLFSTLNISDHM
jgi:hypothetical protein